MLEKFKILKKPKTVLILILLFSAFLRLYRLDFPNKFIFDEVYHAFTAKEYLKGSKEAWEWWTTPPPGVAFEWTHPPLAKEIMAASMFVANSQDGWAWRLPGVLLGVLSVFLIYRIGIKLFNNEPASLIAAFVFSIDGLNFVQSRVGMNDIYFVAFMLFSVYLFLSKKLLLSAIILGLSLSSKWTAVYAYLIFIPLLVYQTRFKTLIFFLTIPALVYLITYIPFFTLGHSVDQFIGLQKQMWWYHIGLKATHDYASPAWSWPFNLYPVWYFVDYKDNTIANIFAVGNPVVFWIGFVAILLTIWEVIRKKSISLLIITLAFFAFWLPWLISPRIMFLYHFSPSVPFLCLALGYQMDKLLKEGQQRLVYLLLILMVLSFILIFPFLTGIHIPKNLINLFFLTNITKNPF